MPRIGNFTPNEPFAQVISNSPGPVNAPNLPDTGSALAEGTIRNASENANNVIQSGNLARNTLFGALGVAVSSVGGVVQAHQYYANKQLKIQNEAEISTKSVPFMYKLHDFRDSVQKDNLSDPDSWSQKFRDGLGDVKDNFYAENKIDPKGPIAQGLNRVGDSFAIAVDNEFTKAAPTQRNANIDADARQSLNQTVNAATNLDSLPTSLHALNALKPALDKLQGEKQADLTIDQHKTKIIMNALKGEAVTNPKRTLDTLDSASDNFNHYLDNDQVREIRTLADNTQKGIEKTAKDKADALQTTKKYEIDDIKYGFTNNPDSTEVDRAKAQNKLLDYKNNSTDPEIRNYAAKAYDAIETKKSEEAKAELEERQTQALERTAKSQERSEQAFQRGEAARQHAAYLSSKPVIKLRTDAAMSYENAYHLDPKLDPGTKLSLINKATDNLNTLREKEAISDAEYIARKGALKLRLNQINESLTPTTGLDRMKRDLIGTNEEHYYDAISAGASPSVIQFRNHTGSAAEALNDNSEFISRLSRYIEAHKAFKKALPNPTQLKQYVDITNNDMKVEGPQ